jgi:adhesin transport system outer membrane protein
MKLKCFALLCLYWIGTTTQALGSEPEGLAAALQAGLQLHPSIKVKLAQTQAKGFVADVARAQRYPSLSAQMAAHDDATHPMNLRARQPVWAFGKIDASIAYADTDLSVEQADLIRVKRLLLDQTAVAYARVLGQSQKLLVGQDIAAELDKLHQQISRREQGQLASVADVRLALARLVQARAQRDRIQGELAMAQNELQSLTQIRVNANQPIPDTLTQLPDDDQTLSLAQQHSADVGLKTRLVALAESDRRREGSATLPTLYLQAERYLNQPGINNNTHLGLVLEASLDGMGSSYSGKNKAATARLQASQDDLDASRNEVQRVTRDLLANRHLQQSLMTSQKQSVDEINEILASFERQYQAGQKTWQDVLNMHRELGDQRLQLVQAENDFLTYTLKLQALTGGLDELAQSTPH